MNKKIKKQSVILPQEMTSWLSNQRHLDLLDLLMEFHDCWSYGSRDIEEFVYCYCDDNIKNAYNIIARAYLDGFKEEEKLYTVLFPNINPESDGCSYYLYRNDEGEVCLTKGVFSIQDNTKLTKQEIESLDWRYFQFAKRIME